MSPRVTAIIVARNGASHLPRTLEALAAQTRQPDVVIAVDCASSDETSAMLAEFGPTHLIAAGEDLSFGAAIATAVRVTTPPTSDDELLWLIAQDNAPDPGALAALVGALEIAPSVAIAGPKQVDWDRGDTIRSLGESMTRYGATVELVSDELDQGQRDNLSDVLAVAAGGMLVRHRVWEALDGFDSGLPVIDDALDFCVRARLAGHRVSVAPDAVVATAGDGVAGANTSHRGRFRRRRARQRRTAELHRRLSYAPAAVVPLHWLSLVPLAVVRSIAAMLGKQPGRIAGEFAAAFTAAFTGISVGSARRRIARTRTAGWSVIAPLRIAPAEMRRRRALLREARIARARGAREEIGFLTTGGAWTLLAAIAAGLVVVSPLFGAAAVRGGGLLPLSATPADLWQNVVYGWRDIGAGFVGAADPFAAVLAVLGSLTFWSPSFAITALWFAAVPLAALGAWFAASRITERGSLRAIAAVLWMLAPPLLTAIGDGRPAPLIAHLLLPWLVFAAFSAARSWSASATASLLFAAVVACAPSLAPALVIAWLVLMVSSGRRFFRIIAIPLPAAVLAAPLVLDQVMRSAWLAVLVDPGVPRGGGTESVWQLLLGFPGGRFGGWDSAISAIHVDGLTPQLLVPILLAPIALIGFAGLFLSRYRTAAFSLGIALLGFATAFAATLIAPATTGSQVVGLWPGAGLSLYWLGITGAVVVGVAAIPRLSLLPGVAAAVLFAVAVVPLALALPRGTADVRAGDQRILPAFVSAAAESDPRAGTLSLIPQADGGILADLQRGRGTTLDDQSTLASTSRTMDAAQRDLAELAGNLASRSAFDTAGALDDERIRFVLLEPAAAASGAADATTRRAAAALDSNPTLVAVGSTEFGSLWRVATDEADAASAAVPARAGGWIATASLIAAIVVFGATLLLSIPTGVGREAQPERRRRERPERAARRANAVPDPEPTGADDPAAVPDAEAAGDTAGTEVVVSEVVVAEIVDPEIVDPDAPPAEPPAEEPAEHVFAVDAAGHAEETQPPRETDPPEPTAATEPAAAAEPTAAAESSAAAHEEPKGHPDAD